MLPRFQDRCIGWEGRYRLDQEATDVYADLGYADSEAMLLKAQWQPRDRLVLGNWQINGISDFRSGQPVNVTVSGDIANTGNVGYMRPNVVGDWHVSNPTVGAWFNKAAFAAPSAFTFGNAGGNILRSDGVVRFDMSLFRNIPIRERFRLQLRAEAYNIFNTVTYNAPTAEFTSVNFGKVTSAMASRSLQIGAQVYF